MFKLALPIHLKENTDREEVLSVLREAGAEYAVLAFDNLILSAEREGYTRTLSAVREYVPFLQAHGYKVGIWFWSLWLGDIDREELLGEVMMSSAMKPRIANSALNSGEARPSGYLCPTSSRIDAVLGIVRAAAEYRPDFLLLNDDMGYATYLDGIGCWCDRHMALISERLGREISRQELRQAVLAGGANEVRRAWLEVTGKSLEDLALRIRQTVDGVDPRIRCGFCCVMSNWGIDGTTAERLARILAGGTRPMLRLIGAPYWAALNAWGNRLQHVIELNRMEAAWLEDSDIELLAEGDVYPRPRHRVPAALLEIYDTALRASGDTDGIFKLMLDYTASLGYERGYLDRHVRSRSLCREIERIFGGKRAIGVRVYESMEKAYGADLTDVPKPESYLSGLFFSHAARMLSDNTVPTVYRGVGFGGVGIAFGENARYLPDEALRGGLILDVRAARILTERGVDVGIAEIGRVTNGSTLLFPDSGERIPTNYRANAAHLMLPKAGAETVTYALTGETRYADAIHYENAEGARFLVYAFDAAFTDENRYRNYATQKQLHRSLEWLSRGSLPAVCLGNPDLYMLCKEDRQGLAIGLWNVFADDVTDGEIRLDRTYRAAEFVGCEGELLGDRIRLSRLEPFGSALIELKR